MTMLPSVSSYSNSILHYKSTLLVVIPFLFLAFGDPVSGLRLLSRNPNDVKFYIFGNKSHVDAHYEITYGDEKSLVSCGYDPTKPLKLLLHGVLSNYKTATDVQVIKNAYLETDTPTNIIMVDYGKLTVSNLPGPLSQLSLLLTISSNLSMYVIATRVAEFILFLMKATVLKGPTDVHLIGFSLGAHISGVTGRLLQEKTGTSVSRITGLDPSPTIPFRRFKLIATNAKFVDVSYTSLARLGNLENLIGLRQGHVQFYINGGDRQPNCPNLIPFVDPFCSHSTASYYFAKSIKTKDIPACRCMLNCRGNLIQRFLKLRNTRFRALQCSSPIVYGECVPITARGNYEVVLS